MSPPGGLLYAGDFVQVWSRTSIKATKEAGKRSGNPHRTLPGPLALTLWITGLNSCHMLTELNYNLWIILVVIGYYDNWMAWPYYSTRIHPSRKNGQSDTKCLLEKPFPSCSGECWFLITPRWHLWGDITISVLHLEEWLQDTPL